jgi:hypothetical protein
MRVRCAARQSLNGGTRSFCRPPPMDLGERSLTRLELQLGRPPTVTISRQDRQESVVYCLGEANMAQQGVTACYGRPPGLPTATLEACANQR